MHTRTCSRGVPSNLEAHPSIIPAMNHRPLAMGRGCLPVQVRASQTHPIMLLLSVVGCVRTLACRPALGGLGFQLCKPVPRGLRSRCDETSMTPLQ
mmetsp:Transcript_64571/g.135524  ORF Transcript_64571/g.135524 Transcript_64571/m.135524 type:complete len:96 (+) Transcript_64571:1269-1556(+)